MSSQQIARSYYKGLGEKAVYGDLRQTSQMIVYHAGYQSICPAFSSSDPFRLIGKQRRNQPLESRTKLITFLCALAARWTCAQLRFTHVLRTQSHVLYVTRSLDLSICTGKISQRISREMGKERTA